MILAFENICLIFQGWGYRDQLTLHPTTRRHNEPRLAGSIQPPGDHHKRQGPVGMLNESYSRATFLNYHYVRLTDLKNAIPRLCRKSLVQELSLFSGSLDIFLRPYLDHINYGWWTLWVAFNYLWHWLIIMVIILISNTWVLTLCVALCWGFYMCYFYSLLL